jgi:hypothetical protein
MAYGSDVPFKFADIRFLAARSSNLITYKKELARSFVAPCAQWGSHQFFVSTDIVKGKCGHPNQSNSSSQFAAK